MSGAGAGARRGPPRGGGLCARPSPLSYPPVENPYRVDATVIRNRAKLLQKYMRDEQKELQALYALQALVVKLEQPPSEWRGGGQRARGGGGGRVPVTMGWWLGSGTDPFIRPPQTCCGCSSMPSTTRT